MALPTADPERQLSHQRSIEVRVYSRGTGLWEVDATVRDVRSKDATTTTATGLLPAGQPIHDMLLRVVVDEQFNVIDAGARTEAQPDPGACENHGDTYGQLVGLDGCHALRSDGALVATHYPRWYRDPGQAAAATSAPVPKPEPKPESLP